MVAGVGLEGCAMASGERELIGVYVNRVSPGEKYLFCSVSIPWEWLPQGFIPERVEVAQLLADWRAAWLKCGDGCIGG